MRLRSLGIRTKLQVIFVAAGLPVLVTTAAIFLAYYRSDSRQAEATVHRTVHAVASEHVAEVEGIHNLLISIAVSPDVVRRDGEGATRLLREVQRLSPYAYNLGIADLEGRLIASAVPGTFTIGDRKYFRDALRSRDFSVGEYVISRAVGKPTLHFAMPVLDARGNPIAVAYTTYMLNRFDRVFEDQGLPPGSVLNVTDHRGVLLYRYPEHPTIKPGLQDQPSIREKLTGPPEEGVFRGTGLDGVRRVFAFRRLRLRPGEPPYVYIRVTIPEKTAFEEATRFALWSSTGFALSGLLAFLLLRTLSRRHLVGPIERLAGVMQAAGGGDLSVRTGLQGRGDEIGLLARAFDGLAESLAARQAERNHAESALREGEAKLRTILDHINDALFVHDLETGDILEVNQTVCTMYGYTREELGNLGVQDLSMGEPPYSQAEALAWMARARAGDPQVFEWQARRKGGDLFWVEVSMRRAPIGGSERLLVLVRDITERKNAEEEKRHLTDQLHQSQKLESIGRLAGGIAHDFNNLLTPVVVYAEMVQESMREGEPSWGHLDKILVAAEKAKFLVQRLMGLGRKQAPDLADLDLNHEILTFAELLRRTIRENIEIQFSPASGPVGVRADRTQLEQILMNLVVNAQDAIPGNGRIQVAVGRVLLGEHSPDRPLDLAPGPYARLTVEDDGSGMDPATADRIFEPFFTTKPMGEGTGLGLATVFSIVHQHRGHVSVRSAPGRGTCFTVLLPECVDRPCANLPPPSPEVPRIIPGGGTVLLAEDNEQVRALVLELLVAMGFRVLEADSPERALSLSEGQHPDLLVSDVIMPGMNGPELFGRLRQAHPGLRGLFISGYTDTIMTELGQLPPGTDFLQKPFTTAAIRAKISALLAGTS
ncbi:MAG: PAS domain S-box protein [Acidobacteria bacterium]|nr:PAS domain S-box protein [Acidobacteriota bacterium]